MIRVLADGRALGDDSAFRGIGSYTRNFLGGLAVLPNLTVAALVTPGTTVPDGITPLTMRRMAPNRWRTAEHELLLPFDLRRHEADVVWSPALDPPRRPPAPVVQTVHDVIPLEDMAGASAESRRLARWKSRYQHAAAIIAPSQYSAEGARRVLGVEASRVHVIPHGVADHFHPDPAVRERSRAAPYILFVGEYDPRKNHAHAFEVIARLAAQGFPHRLLVGRIAPWYEQRLRDLVSSAAVEACAALLRDPAVWRGASKTALGRAGAFSWQTAVQAHAELLVASSRRL